jgi:hypothetical protein
MARRVPDVRIFKNQRGDTIMEVLIAVAVLSLILTVSLALANRNTQGNRQAQERGEATKHTESQIELLKTYLANTANPVLPASGDNFCMKNDGTPSESIVGITDDAQGENFEAFNATGLADCKKGEFFYTYINRDNNTFTAHTRWYKVAGRGVDESTMVHRLYPDVAGAGGYVGTGSTGCAVNQYQNSLGGCVDCPIGMGSPGGAACTAVPSTMRATVRKVNPVGTTTPSCSGTTSNKSGIGVTLTRTGFSATNYTDASSLVTFSGLPLSTPHNITVSAPTDYEVCPPASRNVNSGGPGPAVGVGSTTTVTPEFRVRPICNVPVYGQVDRGYWVTYWWQHTGPTWGPFGLPRANPRYQIGPNGPPYPNSGYPAHYYTAENSRHGYGWVNVRYSSLGGADPEHYNRFEEWYAAGYGAGASRYVWISNWVTEQTGTTCPS